MRRDQSHHETGRSSQREERRTCGASWEKPPRTPCRRVLLRSGEPRGTGGGEEGGGDRAGRRQVKGRRGDSVVAFCRPRLLYLEAEGDAAWMGRGRGTREWQGGEARAPRPRVERASAQRGAAAMGETRGYYWRPVRQSYELAWPSVIGRPTPSAVPFRCPFPSPTGFQLISWTDWSSYSYLSVAAASAEDESSPRF